MEERKIFSYDLTQRSAGKGKCLEMYLGIRYNYVRLCVPGRGSIMEAMDRPYEKKRISTICLGLLILLAGSILASLVFSLLLHFLMPETARNLNVDWWLSAAAQYLVGFPLCAVFISLVPADRMEEYPVSAGAFLSFFLTSCLLMFVGNMVGNQLNDLAAELLGHEPTAFAAEQMMESSLVYSILVTALAAPVWEEIIFRKMLIDRLNRLGDSAAIGISAILFALFHANLQQFFYALTVGWLFGYVYARSGRIRYSIILHMALNFFFGVLPVLAFRSGDGYYSWLIAWLEMIAAACGVVCLIWQAGRIRLRKGWIGLPEDGWLRLAFGNAGMAVLLAGCLILFCLNFMG